MAAISDDKYWFAVYTAPRAEKRVKERFDMAGIENYLPIQTVVRQWHDRRKKVDVPVMPGYIFVYIDRSQYKDVLMTYGALAFLREEGTPVAIPDRTNKKSSQYGRAEYRYGGIQPGRSLGRNSGGNYEG